jgi:hypothetical protein
MAVGSMLASRSGETANRKDSSTAGGRCASTVKRHTRESRQGTQTYQLNVVPTRKEGYTETHASCETLDEYVNN